MSAIPPDEKPPRVSRGLYLRYLIAAALVVTCTAATVASAGLLEVKSLVAIVRTNGHPIPNIKGALDDVKGGGPQTLLVLGSDRRYVDAKRDNPVRSDTLMLVRLDPNKSATAVMSVPRDLKVAIPGRGTDKINAAYALGGPALAVKTVKNLLHIPISHVVNVNFGGFRRAVDRLGCVFVDVDRKYYHSNAGLAPSQQYAEINIPAGYQQLCGQKALDYVRYRHEDSDFVRSARQQDFLRQAKAQIGLGRLFGDRKQLLKIFSAYTDTDLNSTPAILRLLKLAFESSSHPIREVQFRGDAGPEYVTITQQNLRKSIDAFLNVRATGKKKVGRADNARTKPKKKVRTSPGLPPGMVNDRRQAEDYVAKASARLSFPLYFPSARLSKGSYVGDGPRVYDIYDRGHRRHRAYRMVVSAGLFGQYYGVQGTNWKAPPILDNPSESHRIHGRRFDYFYDGDRLRLVSWRTSGAVYWVSNTLLQTLTNKQMIGIAQSLALVGT
jgi:LCP family protein required for cell wall assembly